MATVLKRIGCVSVAMKTTSTIVKIALNKTVLKKINLSEKLSLFKDHWNPKIVGELNNQHIKLAKIKGEFIWHKHDDEDEMFLVLKGSHKIYFRDRTETINENEMIIIK